MNIERFTEKAREAISDADKLARQYNHSQVEVEHLLAALLASVGFPLPCEGMRDWFMAWLPFAPLQRTRRALQVR